MGETTDKLSQASVTALEHKVTDASKEDNKNTGALANLLSKIPTGGGANSMEQTEEIHHAAQAYHFNPDNVCPPEVQQQLIATLRWRDNLFRNISKGIEAIPGLSNMLEELSLALSTCKRSGGIH